MPRDIAAPHAGNANVDQVLAERTARRATARPPESESTVPSAATFLNGDLPGHGGQRLAKELARQALLHAAPGRRTARLLLPHRGFVDRPGDPRAARELGGERLGALVACRPCRPRSRGAVDLLVEIGLAVARSRTIPRGGEAYAGLHRAVGRRTRRGRRLHERREGARDGRPSTNRTGGSYRDRCSRGGGFCVAGMGWGSRRHVSRGGRARQGGGNGPA